MSKKELQFRTTEIKISIDRLTIIGDYPTERFEQHYFEWQRLYPFIRECGQGLQVVDTTNHVNTGVGSPMQQVAYLEVPRFQDNKLRLDFNLNYGLQTPEGQWLLDLIGQMDEKHYSHGNFAFDVLNNSRVADYKWWKFGVTQNILLGRNREIQAIYYGSSKSGQEVRQYNKLVEQRAKGKELVNINSWWRLELQLRTGKVSSYPELVKQMLADFYVPEYKKLNSISEQNMCYRLLNEPDFWGELADRTRAKYRKIFREMPHENEIAVLMGEKFIQKFDKLEKELQANIDCFNIQADGKK
ncbi:replication initiation factor domain-containing protein [Lactiplantibacillus plantarum]|uniref:replication initiation factor domain-containing protein n=1 Tax=Lactiplantibacillus plantarum TaxID=1590 RepID=UPI001BA5D812|nr:replication initiation factor domain-containing protein [Lactiplantibacillus plantarum]MBS0954958.1 replication initiation factor domain-containing protein [Lactiplantibacillus plantarum]